MRTSFPMDVCSQSPLPPLTPCNQELESLQIFSFWTFSINGIIQSCSSLFFNLAYNVFDIMFTSAVAWNSSSFIFIAKLYFVVRICYFFIILSSVDQHYV